MLPFLPPDTGHRKALSYHRMSLRGVASSGYRYIHSEARWRIIIRLGFVLDGLIAVRGYAPLHLPSMLCHVGQTEKLLSVI